MKTYSLFPLALLVLAFSSTTLKSAEPIDLPPESIAGRSLDEWQQDLVSENRTIRLRAILTVIEFGEPAVPILADHLDDADPAMRYWAASGLGDIGTADEATIARLERMLAREKFELQFPAAYALVRFDKPDAAIPVLLKGIEHPSWGTTNTACDFLARLGPEVKSLLPTLEERLPDLDRYAQRKVHEVIRRIREGTPY